MNPDGSESKAELWIALILCLFFSIAVAAVTWRYWDEAKTWDVVGGVAQEGLIGFIGFCVTTAGYIVFRLWKDRSSSGTG